MIQSALHHGKANCDACFIHGRLGKRGRGVYNRCVDLDVLSRALVRSRPGLRKARIGCLESADRLSVALRPALHLRDHMYRKIAANQTSRIKNLDNMIC
jgi:hypothetical protein